MRIGRIDLAIFVAILVFFFPRAQIRAEGPAPSAAVSLVLTDKVTISEAGARNPTVAVDRGSGTVYLAWAREVPGAAPVSTARQRMRPDPKLEVLFARSDDGGRSFGKPIVLNTAQDKVQSASVSPTQVGVGPKGEVYVLYSREDPDFVLEGSPYRGRNLLRLVRSDDGGRGFTAPVEIGGEADEGVVTSLGMANLFVSPDGSVYASWLDTRETFAYVREHKKDPPKEAYASQLRVARSADGGRTFAKSTLAAEPVCVCCGTKVAQGAEGPLFASTRGSWRELKGSYDSVRDIVVASSGDKGATWSPAVKVHNDRFKISGCPDVTPGLTVDTKGRLHAAWYTGTERHPGIFYAVSSDQGKTFSSPVALLTDEWVPYADVKLALDAKDNAWVAFEDRRGDTDLIHLFRIGADGTLARAEPWPGTIPDLAAAGDGVVVASGRVASEDAEKGRGGSVEVRIARPGKGS
jgi:nucleotide-binding universal stress UspA family protein